MKRALGILQASCLLFEQNFRQFNLSWLTRDRMRFKRCIRLTDLSLKILTGFSPDFLWVMQAADYVSPHAICRKMHIITISCLNLNYGTNMIFGDLVMLLDSETALNCRKLESTPGSIARLICLTVD